ncbi:MAG TPA: YrbL family protein [Saccharospirillum sp.]|nr:YrbL family protein [Saccharospirillum sp.]
MSNRGSGPSEPSTVNELIADEQAMAGAILKPGARVFGPLHLHEQTPLARSKTRWIYQHPNDPDLLIKVHIPRLNKDPQSGLKAWAERLKDRFLYTSGIERDLRHYIASRYEDYGPICQRIWPIHGIVETDIGLGLLVAAARDANGALAPTLRVLLDNRQLTPQRVTDLHALLDLLVESPLTFADLNLENIVLEGAGAEPEQFVIVDGLGDRTWIPTQRWVKWERQRKKKEFRAKVHRYLKETGYDQPV